VYRIGVYADAIRARPLRAIAMRIYLAMHRRVRNRYGVELEHTARVGRRLVLAHQANIVIHPYAHIGDDCLVRQNVTIGAALHRDYTPEEFAETAPTLEDGVQVGCGATILGRVVVGRGARIGPNAVVICDVPAGATVFAPPSRMMLVRPDSAEGGDTLRSVTV
jgi:serine O-acetyltransferase